ncbi:MAG: hypothetical protein JSS93_10590 [Bacteroidetes bacterium]|nr:hypothetical protein [Bacteroidota bacterium]
MKKRFSITGLLSGGAVVGNILFILWGTYNGINERFRGTLPEKVSYIALALLLLTNTFLIWHKKKR